MESFLVTGSRQKDNIIIVYSPPKYFYALSTYVARQLCFLNFYLSTFIKGPEVEKNKVNRTK